MAEGGAGGAGAAVNGIVEAGVSSIYTTVLDNNIQLSVEKMDRMVYFDQLVNGIVGGGGVTIPKPKFIKEHKNLLNVLRKGTKADRLREAKDQAKELFDMLKKERKRK